MARYLFTRKAVEDLTGIYEYTLEFWSESQADKYYNELISFCQMLAESPRIGKHYVEIGSDIFGLLFNKHLIFYRMLNEEEIEILRILGADMDLKNRIKE